MSDIVQTLWDAVFLGKLFGVENVPTVTPADSFDPKKDAESLRNAMKGDGANEKEIIDILTRRTASQRQQIKASFKELYDQDLVKELKDELKGKLEDILVALMTPMYDVLAKEIHRAVDGLGTDEADLVEIICSASNADLREIKGAYARLYEETMEKAIAGDTSGDFRKLLITMLQGARDEGTSVDEESAQKDVKKLLIAGALQLGTDEDTFTEILTKRSYVQLKQIISDYKTLSGRTLISDIEDEFSGDIKCGLIAIVKSTVNKPEFFAERLHSIVEEKRNRDLIRVFVTRSEIDLGNIKQEYEKLYGKTLESDIVDKFCGDYKNVLLGLLED